MIPHHEFWWHFFPKKELTKLYFSTALRSFGVSLLGLFIPLYLVHELGYALEQALYFYLFYAVIFAVLSPMAAKVVSRYGMKHTIFLSVPFYLAFIGLLYLLPMHAVPLYVVSAFAGVSMSLYWMGLHLVFHHYSHHQHRGEEVGKRDAVSIMAAILGPSLGGFLILLAGFKLVFLLSAVLLLISISFLLFGKEDFVKYNFSMKSMLNFRHHWRDSLYFVSRGSYDMSQGVLWPLFIFTILGGYFTLGIMGSLLTGIGAILVWQVGKYSDGISKRKIVKMITGFEFLSWLARAAVSSLSQVFAVTVFGAITHGIGEAPLAALEYDKAGKGVSHYFVSREIYVCLGRILLILIVLMTDNIAKGFVFNGLVGLAALLF